MDWQLIMLVKAGLAILWKEEVDFKVKKFSNYHIHGVIKAAEVDNHLKNWWLTGVYGHRDSSQCQEVWDLIRTLRSDDGKPWLVFGDFNEILQTSEKSKGRDRSATLMGNLWDLVSEYELRDLGFKCLLFT